MMGRLRVIVVPALLLFTLIAGCGKEEGQLKEITGVELERIEALTKEFIQAYMERGPEGAGDYLYSGSGTAQGQAIDAKFMEMGEVSEITVEKVTSSGPTDATTSVNVQTPEGQQRCIIRFIKEGGNWKVMSVF